MRTLTLISKDQKKQRILALATRPDMPAATRLAVISVTRFVVLLRGSASSGGWAASGSDGGPLFVSQERFAEKVETSLTTAGKLIDYRVLECGVVYEYRHGRIG